jgi:predicted MPP superfamily phosphohydrolase
VLLRSIVFFVVVTSMWVGLHWLVGHRQIHRGRAYPLWLKRTIWVVIALLASVPLLAFFGRMLGLGDVAALQWTAYVLLGLSTLLITFTVIVELALAVVALRRRFATRSDPAAERPDMGERRQFFADVLNFGIVGGAAGLSAVGFAAARRVPRVVEVSVPVANLHPDLEGLRIVQLSDVHVGPTIRGTWLDKVVEVVNTLDADVVALTGDFVDGQVAKLGPELAALGRIRSTHGAFFVTGNHEYYWDGPAWCAAIQEFGPTVLINEHRCIEHGQAKLLVAGVTDPSAGGRAPGHTSDPAKAKAGAPAHDFSLLLAHQPKSIEAAAQVGFDLQLSGHTHAGQYFPGSVLIHLFQPYVSGLNRHGDNMQIYVSAGTGYWGPPNRAGSPSEITLLTLQRA